MTIRVHRSKGKIHMYIDMGEIVASEEKAQELYEKLGEVLDKDD